MKLNNLVKLYIWLIYVIEHIKNNEIIRFFTYKKLNNTRYHLFQMNFILDIFKGYNFNIDDSPLFIEDFPLDRENVLENYIKDWIVIGGLTGSGKTDFLRSFKESIDLERIANHRGSAFGVRDGGQPTQSNFENILTLDYLNHKYEKLILEDESRTIGRAGLPGFWYQKMQSSKLVILEVDDDKRAENIYYEYVYDELNNGVNEDILLEKYLGSLNNIKRRLGNVVYNNIKDLMKSAFRQNEKEIHKEWILTLLTSYYDKMYSYKLDMRKDFIVHKGEIESCRYYINAML